MTSPNYRLVSFNLCPFVQRSVITLNEKNAKYEIEYIDLANKPDWFLKISPRGLVPVLDIGEAQLFESAAINEFIDETTDGNLMPADPVTRAQHRAWIAVAGDLNGPAYVMMVGDEEKTRAAAAKARQELERFERYFEDQSSTRGDGAFFAGDAFSLVDATIAPPLQRMAWAEEIVSFGIFDGLPKVIAWRDALLARKSVTSSTIDDIKEVFRDYLAGKGSPTRSAPSSWLGEQIA